MVSRRVKRLSRRALSVSAIVALGTANTPAFAQPSPAKQYEELAAQAAQADEDLLKAKDDLAARQRELSQADTDLSAAERSGEAARTQQQQFRGQVDNFAAASFRGARFHNLSAMMTSSSAEDFLDRMSALNVLATDNGNALDQLTASVNQAAQAESQAEAARSKADEAADSAAALVKEVENRKTELDGKIKQVRAALNKLSPAQRADLSRVKDNGIYLGPPGAANTALQAALSKRGSEYEWAAAGPDDFDCSGLTMWAYGKAGIVLPHSSRSQYTMGRGVPLDQLQPGDLLFYDDGTGNPAKIHHVGMYVGDGKMVDAPTEGQVVDVRSTKGDGHLMGARRIAG